MNIASLGRTIILADLAGDRPAVITRVFGNTSVEVCGFMPLPEHIRMVSIHPDRHTALQAMTKDATGFHGYWPART